MSDWNGGDGKVGKTAPTGWWVGPMRVLVALGVLACLAVTCGAVGHILWALVLFGWNVGA